MTMSSKIAATI